MTTRAHYPRPEYPRPEHRRGLIEGVDWLNLNGPWQFRFDGARVGEKEQWFRPDQPAWAEQITVPFCWESLMAWGDGNAAGSEHYYSSRIFLNPLEVTLANHRTAKRYEVGWYRREVRVPKEWLDGRRVILHIGAADFFTDGWCNGIHVGHHEGGYTPFEFDITDTLIDGKGVIVLRVEDPMDNHEQPVGKQWSWYTTTSGIWQTVFLEPRPLAHIDHYHITTNIHTGEVHFEIECIDCEEGAPIEVAITSPSGDEFGGTCSVRGGLALFTSKVFPVELWEPDHPNLYQVVLRLTGRQDDHQDVVRTYFGMREITTQAVGDPRSPGSLILNGRPIYLRGLLYQSFYPEGVYTAGDASTLRDDILFAKKAGFQFLRIHIKLDDPMFLYYADTLGILIMEDFPNFGEGGDTPLGRRRFEEMMRKGIQRDWNHPSIIAWCLFNETWGFGGQVELVKHFGENPHAILAEPNAPVKIENRSAQQWVQQMWELAKSLDSTRLIEDMSVVHWEHLHYYAHGDTDINSWHFYIDDYDRAKAHIEKVVAETYKGSKFNYEEGYAQGHQPLINSEYGGIGALDGDRDISWSFKFLTNELRRHGSLSAYIYTEHHDVEWERNGFLNYDRTVKEFGYDPTIINAPDVLPINAPPIQTVAPGEFMSIEVASSHYSRHQPKSVQLFWRLSGINPLGHVFHDLASGQHPIPFTQYRVVPAGPVEFYLPNEPMLCTLWVYAIDENGTTHAANYIQFFVSKGFLPEREERDNALILRGHVHQWCDSHWEGEQNDRADAERTGRCFGFGYGYYDWRLPLTKEDLHRAQRIRILCEASAKAHGATQTDSQRRPTTFAIFLNGIRVHQAVLPDHPHDSRGALSYLHGGYGGYGYLSQITAEGTQLQAIREHAADDHIHLRCCVPENAKINGGLTIYGDKSGRYPVPPTLIVEY